MFKKIKEKIGSIFTVPINHIPKGGIESLPKTTPGFIWFFLRQVKWLLLLMAILAATEAFFVSSTYWFIGQLSEATELNYQQLIQGICIISGIFIFAGILRYTENILYIKNFGNTVRRQLFHYTVQHSLAYFQNDFAGRIANKLLQCGPALRDATLSVVVPIVYVGTIATTNLIFMTQVDFLLALPMMIWLVLYVSVLFFFLPKIKERSTKTADSMSMLTGQVVDSFTNILAAKYFARTKGEDARAVEYLEKHGYNMGRSLMLSTNQSHIVYTFNFLLVASTMCVGYWLAMTKDGVGISGLIMALPMVVQATFWSGWIMREMAGIFENLGTVQETIDTITQNRDVIDKPNALDLKVNGTGAAIKFDNVSFHYDQKEKHVMSGFNLEIPAGQKVGVVGRSGAGKSTVTSLLVRAYDVESGAILINGQNVADVTQDSLRKHITVVTQDSYLFHRSVRDNIRYANPDASDEEVIRAAEQAYADDFIAGLEDNRGRRSLEAHVGERGVKLSGGQKQRISIARAILKDAPILVLDEATSALDSESEEAIQHALSGIMEDKTVIAIAHRLSTLRQMDRIIVMDAGHIIEDGTHDSLVADGGHYADLWARQSGGFIAAAE